MKRKFSVLIVSAVIVGLTLSLVGMALAPQVASAEKNQNSDRQVPKPVSATDVKIVKKIPLLPTDVYVKGKPTSHGQDKNKEKGPAATGELGATSTGAKYAVVIGICDYPGTKNDICTSDGDSLHMYKALIELYGYKKANIHLLKDMATTTKGNTTSTVFADVTYELPTYTNIWSAVMDIKKKATSTDEVVFFFSGHGARGEADDGDAERIDEAIVVHGDKGTDTDDNIAYIWDGELKSWFGDFGTTRIAFVFDTCLAGGWNDLADEGRVISMATGETQPAYVYSKEGKDVDGDGTPDGEGVFSHYFVNEGMLQGKADKYDHNGDGILGKDVVVEEAFDYAKASITIPTQKPVISDKFTNDLLL